MQHVARDFTWLLLAKYPSHFAPRHRVLDVADDQKARQMRSDLEISDYGVTVHYFGSGELCPAAAGTDAIGGFGERQ